MKKARLIASLLFALGVLLTSSGAAGSATFAPPTQNDSHFFPETKRTVKGRFLKYWQEHGGLPQQGYPISEELQERSDTDGKTYTVQYFERAVFELHPENKPPNDVLLSLLGVFLYQQKYPNGAPNQTPNNSGGSVLFKETGHRVGGKFLKYWQEHGALAQQGYPISDEFTEVSDLDGKPYKVQYFERAVFEEHPENAGTPHEVLLSQLGTFRYKQKRNPDGTPKLSPTVVPATPTVGRPEATATRQAENPTIVTEYQLGSLRFKSERDNPNLNPSDPYMEIINPAELTLFTDAFNTHGKHEFEINIVKGDTYKVDKTTENGFIVAGDGSSTSIGDFSIQGVFKNSINELLIQVTPENESVIKRIRAEGTDDDKLRVEGVFRALILRAIGSNTKSLLTIGALSQKYSTLPADVRAKLFNHQTRTVIP